MRFEKRKCDICGTETEDRYTHFGWINICSSPGVSLSFTVSMYRELDGLAKSGYASKIEYDFCSTGCLVELVEGLADADEVKTRIKEKDRVFSGDYSSDMWNAINKANTRDDLRSALYFVCCRIQELESKLTKSKGSTL